MSTDQIFYDDDLVLSPQVEAFDLSLSGMYSFLNAYESFQDTVLFTDQPREFLHVSGESSIQLSGDTPAFVYLDNSSSKASVEGGDHIFVINGKFGEFEVSGGNTTVFLNELPEEASQISVKGGVLELNFLSQELGAVHEISLDGNDLLVDGLPSNISILMEDDASQIATVVLSSVDKVSTVIGVTDLPEVILEDGVGSELADFLSQNDLGDFEIPDGFLEGVYEDISHLQATQIDSNDFVSSNDLHIELVDLYETSEGSDIYKNDVSAFTMQVDETFANLLEANESVQIWTDLDPIDMYEL